MTVVMRTEDRIDRFHWTVDTFYRALDARVFDHPERLELIRGEIIEKVGQNAAHATLTSQIARLVRALLEPQFTIRDEKPIRLAMDGEAIPDAQVVADTDQDYAESHPRPEDVELLIEVANSSLAYDLEEKATLYAQAGITDYWVSDMIGKRVLIHRDPAQTPDGDWRYQSVTPYSAGQILSPLCAPEVEISVTDLLPRA